MTAYYERPGHIGYLEECHTSTVGFEMRGTKS